MTIHARRPNGFAHLYYMKRKNGFIHLYYMEEEYPIRLCDWVREMQEITPTSEPVNCHHCRQIEKGERLPPLHLLEKGGKRGNN